MTLTEDQRWLLAGVGDWMMAECLISPDFGIPQLMQSMSGASNARRAENYPAWLAEGYVCGRGRIVSPWILGGRDPHVSVTATELRKFASSLEATTRDLLAAVRRESIAQTIEWRTACRCGNPAGHAPDTNPLTKDRWHPTPEQVTQNRHRTTLLRERTEQRILEACGLTTPTIEQLTLFL